MIGLLSGAQSIDANPALSDKEARLKAAAAINEAINKGGPSSKLYTTRLEKIENDFLDFQIGKYDGHIGKGVFVYEVSEAGSDPEFDEHGSRGFTVVMDADPRWFVAVSRETGQTYPLSGFEESASEFNRMTYDLHVRVNDDNAENYAIFFLSLTYGPETDYVIRPKIVSSAFELKQTAEKNFHSCYSKETYERRFISWWSAFTKTNPKFQFKPTVVKQDDGYTVSLTVFQPMRFKEMPFKLLDKDPMLVEIGLTISKNGRIEIANHKPLFPTSSR